MNENLRHWIKQYITTTSPNYLNSSFIKISCFDISPYSLPMKGSKLCCVPLLTCFSCCGNLVHSAPNTRIISAKAMEGFSLRRISLLSFRKWRYPLRAGLGALESLIFFLFFPFGHPPFFFWREDHNTSMKEQ